MHTMRRGGDSDSAFGNVGYTANDGGKVDLPFADVSVAFPVKSICRDDSVIPLYVCVEWCGKSSLQSAVCKPLRSTERSTYVLKCYLYSVDLWLGIDVSLA